MSDKASATYVINSDYNIVTYNHSAKETYPQLARGQKCHQLLMGLSEPCEVCPVKNNVLGPQTYVDPIRNIHETVDAVPMILEDGSEGYALVLSTVGEREDIAKRLPTNEEEYTSLMEQENYDSLTGGLSRLGFIKQAESILSENQGKKEYAVLIFDPMNFKAINQIFGFAGGNELLRYIYDYLKGSVIAPVLVARIEADHMACLVPVNPQQERNLSGLLDFEWNYGNQAIHIYSRCGIYLIKDDTTSGALMLDRANIACQMTAKSRQSIAFYDENLRSTYIGQAEVLSSFEQALSQKEFEVFLQPIVETKTNQIVSAEALVRWKHEQTGYVFPDKFIPVLEGNGFITRLDQYMFDAVYEIQMGQMKAGRTIIPISVNLSWQDFYNNPFINEILQKLTLSGLPEGSIQIEVTETAIAGTKQNGSYLLDQIRDSGATVLLDDFGSGYSTFGMIRNYNFDIVKIDQTFIRQLEENEKVREIVRSIINMCHQLSLRVIAEGVETEEERKFLAENGCDFVQGYYYTKPVPVESFREFFLDYSGAFDAEETAKGTSHLPKLSGQSVTKEFLENVLDHSGQFIQICYPDDYTMVYANQVTKMISVDPNISCEGQICYQYMLGLDQPCGHCPMKQMGDDIEKEIEVDDGQHVFALKARFMEYNHKKVFVEYGRDVTEAKRAQERYHSQIDSILRSIPDEQGIFHVDLTADEWISSAGNAQNARDMQEIPNVDTLIRMIGSFVPDQKGQDEFFDIFNQKSLLKAYDDGKREVTHETLSYYDDQSIRWSRIIAKLIVNPETEHLEAVIYGVDISRVKENEKQLEEKIQKMESEYQIADHDRRHDFLTGLYNRLELFNMLERTKEGTASPIRGMLMLDIDDFKKINDTYGHIAGDACLVRIAAALDSYGQKHQISFYRYGGEEFLGVITEESTKTAEEASYAVLDIFHGLTIYSKGKVIDDITASVGYTTSECAYDTMIDHADHAMYRAKKMGKDQVQGYERNA